nr:ankyrin repeat domain-containing protein [Endozoicomonas sp. ONNA2]
MCQDQDRVNEGCSWSSECPPLLLAAEKQDASLVRTALLNGARISETFEGKNVLHRAAEQGSIAVLEELAKHPDFKMILNATSDSGATPLILSVVGNNPKMTGRLVDLGASIDQTWSGKNALEYALEKGDLDALNALGQHRDFKLILNARNTDGQSPLMQAVGPKWPIIQRLLILGARYSDN